MFINPAAIHIFNAHSLTSTKHNFFYELGKKKKVF